MRTHFFWSAFGFTIGIVMERWFTIPIGLALSLLGVGVFALWLLRGRRAFLPLFLALMVFGGISSSRLDSIIPEKAVQKFVGSERVVLTGVVSSLPDVKVRGKRVSVATVLRAKSLSGSKEKRRQRMAVTGQVQVFLIQPPFVPQVGDELRLWGSLEAPRQVLNPGEFDYGKFLSEKNIHAIFQTIGPRSVKRIREGAWYLPERLLAEARKRLASWMDHLYAPSEAAMMKALVLGLRSDVAPEVRDQFMKTGTIHLFATANTKRDFAPFPNKIIAAYSP